MHVKLIVGRLFILGRFIVKVHHIYMVGLFAIGLCVEQFISLIGYFSADVSVKHINLFNRRNVCAEIVALAVKIP